MRYQVDFLLSLKLQKISYYFGLCQKILLGNQFAGFFTFDLVDLLILILRVHCYIVLVVLSVRQAFGIITEIKLSRKLEKIMPYAAVHSKPFQTSKIELFTKIINLL